MLRYWEAIHQSYLSVVRESACTSHYETDHQFWAVRRGEQARAWLTLPLCRAMQWCYRLAWTTSPRSWGLSLKSKQHCYAQKLWKMRQSVGNPGRLHNLNSYFQQKPVIWEARICPRGFSAVFSNEIKSLATFGMIYLVVTKYFCHRYGVIFPCGYWLAYHFLCLILPRGLLAP